MARVVAGTWRARRRRRAVAGLGRRPSTLGCRRSKARGPQSCSDAPSSSPLFLALNYGCARRKRAASKDLTTRRRGSGPEVPGPGTRRTFSMRSSATGAGRRDPVDVVLDQAPVTWLACPSASLSTTSAHAQPSWAGLLDVGCAGDLQRLVAELVGDRHLHGHRPGPERHVAEQVGGSAVHARREVDVRVERVEQVHGLLLERDHDQVRVGRAVQVAGRERALSRYSEMSSFFVRPLISTLMGARRETP